MEVNTHDHPLVFVTRQESFSAAHRLHSSKLTDEENLEIYGKCNNEHFHGHNYTVKVTIRGPVHPETGMVVNLSSLKEAIRELVVEPFDHKNLDLEVSEFSKLGIPSTMENLAVIIWKRLFSRFKQLLYEVVVQETNGHFATYRGETLYFNIVVIKRYSVIFLPSS
ncbi:6-pyruvoyl tetrahydrobiopterin synthase [Galdieria sulphuraria]|nr:6-pyruvoyl tetrahydrobiopterin synthase [Galdieria sulphuraria]